jgi:hypothetical protein
VELKNLISHFPYFSSGEYWVYGYETLQPIEELSQHTIETSQYSIMFYSGVFDYLEKKSSTEAKKVDYKFHYSLSYEEVEKSKNTNWIFTLFRPNLLEAESIDKEIEGVISIFFGSGFINERIFTHKVSNTLELNFDLNKKKNNQNVLFEFEKSKISAIKNMNSRLQGFDIALRTSLQRSFVWISDALHSSGADSFLRLWIAIEIAFTTSNNTVRELRKRVSIAYQIENERVNQLINLGKLYGIRNTIVHKGGNPTISQKIIDCMFLLFVDLLDYKINGESEKKLILFLNNEEKTFEQIINNA